MRGRDEANRTARAPAASPRTGTTVVADDATLEGDDDNRPVR